MAHWSAEQISLDPKFQDESMPWGDHTVPPTVMASAVLSYWSKNTNQSVAFSALFRSNYSSAYIIPPHYKMYTLATLGDFYVMFWALMLIQCCIILILKLNLSDQFHGIGWTERILHVIETLNLPDCFGDWDSADGSYKEHMDRWKASLKEVMAMSVLHFLSNMIMLLPIIITGKKH